jgi:hypothetical protein
MAQPLALTPAEVDLSAVASDDATWPVIAEAANRSGVGDRTLRWWVQRNHIIAARSPRGRIHIFWPSLVHRLSGPGDLIADGTGSPAAR